MGIAIPRPQMRQRERRIIEATMARHSELMTKFEADGMSRQEASAKAYEQVQQEKRDGHFK